LRASSPPRAVLSPFPPFPSGTDMWESRSSASSVLKVFWFLYCGGLRVLCQLTPSPLLASPAQVGFWLCRTPGETGFHAPSSVQTFFFCGAGRLLCAFGVGESVRPRQPGRSSFCFSPIADTTSCLLGLRAPPLVRSFGFLLLLLWFQRRERSLFVCTQVSWVRLRPWGFWAGKACFWFSVVDLISPLPAIV